MKRGYQIRKMGLYKGIIRNKEVSKQDEWRVCRVEEEASGMITLKIFASVVWTSTMAGAS